MKKLCLCQRRLFFPFLQLPTIIYVYVYHMKSALCLPHSQEKLFLTVFYFCGKKKTNLMKSVM